MVTTDDDARAAGGARGGMHAQRARAALSDAVDASEPEPGAPEVFSGRFFRRPKNPNPPEPQQPARRALYGPESPQSTYQRIALDPFYPSVRAALPAMIWHSFDARNVFVPIMKVSRF